MTIKLFSPFTPTERLIAEGIRAGLSYTEIGAEIGQVRKRSQPISQHTVRVHVNAMARKIDGTEDLAPRQAVYMLLKFGEWEASKARSA